MSKDNNAAFDPFENLVLDQEEQELEDMIERGEFVPYTGKEAEMWRERLEEAARNTMADLRKDKTISLRLPGEILERTKAKAAKLGIPYQTLIGSWVHQQATKDEVSL